MTRDGLALAADMLDATPWSTEVLDAVHLVVQDVPGMLPSEAVAVFTAGGFDLGFADLADAVCELAVELRLTDRRLTAS